MIASTLSVSTSRRLGLSLNETYDGRMAVKSRQARPRGSPIAGSVQVYQPMRNRIVARHTIYIDQKVASRLIRYCDEKGLSLSDAVEKSLRTTLPREG
jgi:hypothetical protein